jgi:hypothetical protein
MTRNEATSAYAPLQCRDLTIRLAESELLIRDSETVSKVRCDGVATLFDVSDDQGTHLQVANVSWDTGERDIRAIGKVRGPMPLRRLERGSLRMSVSPLEGGKAWVELSQARIKPHTLNRWSTLKKASKEQLDEGSGIDTLEALYTAGAERIGEKKTLLGESGRRSTYHCAIFDGSNVVFPVVAFVLTRVLPLLNEYTD